MLGTLPSVEIQAPDRDAASKSLSPPSQDHPQTDSTRVKEKADPFRRRRGIQALANRQKEYHANCRDRPRSGRPSDSLSQAMSSVRFAFHRRPLQSSSSSYSRISAEHRG